MTTPGKRMVQALETRTAEQTISRVVVVDDSSDDRAEIRRLLLKGSAQRYQFVEAETGAAAVSAVLNGDPPEFLVLDYNLPDLDAPDVIDALVGADGLTVCPVLVLTGADGDIAARSVLRPGAYDYISKYDLTPKALVRTLDNVVERWQMARELAVRTSAMRADEQRYRALVDATGALAWSCPPSGRHVTQQLSWMAFTGQRPEETLGEGWTRAVHPDDLAEATRWWSQTVERGTPSSHEHRIRRHDGHWRWMLVYAAPLRDLDGRIIEWSGMCIDVSERKEAEQALIRNAALFSNIIQQAPGGMYVVDAQFRLAQVNAQAMPVFASVRPLIGRDFGEVMGILWGPDVGAQCAVIFRHTLATGERYVSDRFSEQRHDIGGEQAYEWQIERLTLPDGNYGVVCYFQDVTDRVRRDRNLALLAELQELSAASSSAEDLMRAVGARLVHVLRLTHCIFVEVDEASDCSTAIHDEHMTSARNLAGTYRIGAFHSPEEQRRMASGDALVMADVRNEATRERAAQFEALGIRAFVNAAHIGSGTWRFVLHASCDKPRTWHEHDIELIRDVAERVYPRIERLRAETALRENQERLRLAVEAASTGLWTWDVASDAVTWSPECYVIHGIPVGAYGGTGAEFFRLVHPDDRARVEATVRQAFDSQTLYECEFRIVRPDGTVAWVVNRGRRSRGATDAATRMLGTITDISDRKRAENERRAGEEALRLALSAAKAGAWGWDVQTGAISWSPENYTLYGLDPAGGPPAYADWERKIHPEDLGACNAAVEDALAGRTSEYRAEFRVLHPDTGTRWLLGLGRVEFGVARTAVRMFGINLDITERKQFEATLAAQDRRKDEFLATLAHELRTPLAPIRNGLTLLKRSRLDAAAEKLRAMVDRQVDLLVYLVDDLLDVARLSQGKVTLRKEPLAVSAAIDAAVEACRPTIEAKNHELTITVVDPPPVVDADRARIVQVLSNLLTNATKYSPPGSRIAVSAQRHDRFAEIAVVDTGIGIAPESLPFVWNMFTQVHDTLNQAQGGLGIGLSLVKKLVEMHGGEVAATSAGIGRGTTFTVRLPLAARNVAAIASRRSSFDESLPAGGLRILVVDDNADAAFSLCEILRILGNEVHAAHDGEAALAAVQAYRPDAVLCDIGMPRMDGHELARRIRAQAWGRDLVLVALTGFERDADQITSGWAGFDGHLIKPVDIYVLMALLLSLCNKIERRTLDQ